MADGGQFMDGIQSLGVVNAMKTGNMQIDMMIAMCIPIVLRIMFSFVSSFSLERIMEQIRNFFMNDDDGIEYFTRNITHVEEKDEYQSFNSLDGAVKNEILIKAITMYLEHLKCMKTQHAHLKLTRLQDGDNYSYDSDDDSDISSEERGRFSYQLLSYRVVKNPPPEEWHPTGCKYPKTRPVHKTKKGSDLDEILGGSAGDVEMLEDLHGVDIRINEREERPGGGDSDNSGQNTGNSNNATPKGPRERRYAELSLRSTGEESVDQFIDEAYHWYVSEIKKGEDRDKSRYYYDLKDKDYSESQSHEFKRYKLSDDKTFDSLFFRERDTIVRLLKHFLSKTGKYGIQGYPYKLGLLLHGPPGTGKTSLIKAIAQLTGRSIVNIPLARIKTNEELNRLFFSDEYHYDGSYYPKKMSFKDVIFVMEDIDAASKVVQRRDGKRTPQVAQTAHVKMPRPKSMWRMLLESQGESCIELVENLIEKSERLKENAMSSETLTGLAQRMNSIPGLSVVGLASEVGGKNSTVKKIASDAIEDGQEMINGCKSLDEYLDFHAKSLLKLVQMGAEVDEAFEDELLGEASSKTDDDDDDQAVAMRKPGSLSRDVSYNKYDGQVEVETIDRTSQALSKLAEHAMKAQQLHGGFDDRSFGGGVGPAGPKEPSFFTGKAGVGLAGMGGLGMDDPLELGGFGGGFGGGLGGGAGKAGAGKGGGGNKGGGGGWDKGGGWGGLGGFGGFGGFGPLRDELNLSGLLNVLDGVVDTPGRILVMTTNHPEKLDPALIRPGRIDKKLILGYMDADDVVRMLEHYFQIKLDPLQVERVRAAVIGGGSLNRPALSLTPAQVEQLTAEHDVIEDMIGALEEKGKPIMVGGKESEVSRIMYD